MPEETPSRSIIDQPEQQAMRRVRRKRQSLRQAAPVVLADDLPPALKDRVRSLLRDLSADDVSMALLDLAHLYRAVAGTGNRVAAAPRDDGNDQRRVLIFGEDETTVADVCAGPDQSGICPRAQGESVACADRWLMASGWMFKVAPEADLCPLVPLGLASRSRSAITGRPQEGRA